MLARLFGNINYTGSYQDIQMPGRYSKADGSLQVSPRSFQADRGVRVSLYQNGLATHSTWLGNAQDVGATWYDKIDAVVVEAPAQPNVGPTYVQPPAPGSAYPGVPVAPSGYSYTPQYAGQAPVASDAYGRMLYPIPRSIPLWNPPRRRRRPDSSGLGGQDFLTTLLTVKLLGGL